MTTQPSPFSLKDALDFADDPSAFTFAIKRDECNGDEPVEVDFYDEGYAGDDFFVAGHEHGPEILIRARSFEGAWEAWIDECKTIPEDELPEAYGIPDREDVRDAYVAGHGEAPPYWERDAWDAWHDGLHLARAWWLRCYDGETNPLDGSPLDDLPLVEGYEYQSNASGTGIVYVGHYAWMNEIDPEDVVVTRKKEEKKGEKKSA